ncbi:MAG: hypothetical protein ABID79_02335, partial [Elusimicrobiota bacterium]
TFIIGVIYKFIFVYLHPFSGKEACQKMLIFDKGDAIFYLTCFSIDDKGDAIFYLTCFSIDDGLS